MTHLSKALMMAAVLGLAACTNGNRFDNEAGAGYGADAGAGSGIVPGSASDPASPAYFSQTIGDRVFFAVDQSTLSPEARATLDGQAGWLLSNSDYLAVIEGHADEQGTREYNIALGARRANATMEYLISKGVPASRLKFISYGKERPVEICSEEACYSKNRRAVTVISMGLGS
ncbi:peptidoglycan-associated lipoprotein Pal [Salipiger sp. P9]|uniref:peptidoglycan-associated lipoprotein Pal n=1 Tax=Salipiger pentaromativorans TaxID=2943193 RepID=UPI0021577F43|nr:peptidoglycan-associated lipoprotein Pal [Salipiger pentaromativorans]MCR8549333.1 peptidoglycan-associated lipoprotein Pal [Salipiger pentaromativorans]